VGSDEANDLGVNLDLGRLHWDGDEELSQQMDLAISRN
jgi:hypothetical protein